VTDTASRVATALKLSVLPSVMARGGDLRVAAVVGDLAIIEVTGSPGAVLPLVSRIEAQVLGAVPEVAQIRFVGPGGEVLPTAATDDSAAVEFAERVRQVLDGQINPIVSAHHGGVRIASIGQGWVRIRLEGRCQGCSLAEVTVRQGIEPVLRACVPDVVGVVDVTDHGAGPDPYFSAAKR
jgi:Fe-S cluster biogenesis protein NfuA